MWPASKAIHFEPIEHIFFIKWFKKWIFYLVALLFKISKWKFWMIWFFIKFIQWTCTFIKGGMLLLYKKIKSIIWFYAFLLITFKKMYLKHLNPLIYKTQRDINIISILFLNIFTNLKRHHFIYWHTTIHCNYNNVSLKKIQSCPL